MSWPLTVDPYWSRRLARVMRDSSIRAMGSEWWWRFLIEAQRVSSIDDLSAEFRDVIKPLMEQ